MYGTLHPTDYSFEQCHDVGVQWYLPPLLQQIKSVLRGKSIVWYPHRRPIVVSSHPAHSTNRKLDSSSKCRPSQHPDHRISKMVRLLHITRFDNIMFEGCQATYLPLLAHWPKEFQLYKAAHPTTTLRQALVAPSEIVINDQLLVPALYGYLKV